MCRTIKVGLTLYIDIRNSTIVRCHSNVVLVRSNAVNHNHPTLWSTMYLTIRCDQQALINHLFIYILACTDDEKLRLALELGRSERKKYFNRLFRNRVHILKH